MKSTAWRGSDTLPNESRAEGGRDDEELQRESEEAARQKADAMHLAQSLEPLKSLSESHLGELLNNSEIEVVFRDHVLFESGSYDFQHIYLLHGDVALIDREGNQTLERGGSSMLPLAHGQPRPCRAVAQSDCSLLRVDSEYLDKMLTWSQVAEYLLLDVSYQRDLDEDADWMMTILKSNLFFKVPPTNAPVIFDRVKTMVVDAGEAVLRQGEIADNCYFIKQGYAEVRQSPDGSTPPQKVAEIGPGRCFGEDGLVYEQVRNASVIMLSDGVLMYISKRDFLKLLKEPKVDTASAGDVARRVAEGAVCIDVRTVEEYEAGHLDRAVNIPLNLLRIKTRLLDSDAEYVLYCDTGRRSRAAAQLLKKNKFKVTALHGGLNNSRTADRQRLPLTRDGYILKDGQVVAGR